jgi:hypothetical protein
VGGGCLGRERVIVDGKRGREGEREGVEGKKGLVKQEEKNVHSNRAKKLLSFCFGGEAGVNGLLACLPSLLLLCCFSFCCCFFLFIMTSVSLFD